MLIYRNYPLEVKNDNITRALVFVHGINRDADNHFRTVLAAAFLAGALNITIIVSPRFSGRHFFLWPRPTRFHSRYPYRTAAVLSNRGVQTSGM